MGILFIGANIAHKLWIGNFVGSAGDFIFGDEVNGVGARNTAPDSLCEAAKFIGKGLIPDGFFIPFIRWRNSWSAPVMG